MKYNSDSLIEWLIWTMVAVSIPIVLLFASLCFDWKIL